MPALRCAAASEAGRRADVGLPVFGPPPLARASSAGPASVPLTALQKARLIVDCLPLAFFVLAFVFSVTLFDDIYGAPPSAALLLFLGIVILVTGYQALQRMRDLASGVALVQDDLLERLWRPRRGSGHYGKFEQVGTLRLRQKACSQSQPGLRHRIIYSPASKVAWSLEPLG